MNAIATTNKYIGERTIAIANTGLRLWRHLEDTVAATSTSTSTSTATSTATAESETSDPVTVHVHTVTKWVGIVAISLTVIGITLSLASAFFLYRFRNHQIISVGQPPFLYLICVGAILLSISSSLNTSLGDDVSGRSQASLDASCTAWIWCVSVGDLVIYLALLCKLWRVEKVARFRKRQVIRVRHVIWPFVAVIVVAIGILIGWTVTSPPYYKREVVEADDDGTLHSIGICFYDDGGVYQLALTIVYMATVGVVFWLSLRTRNLPESLSDSRRITQTLLAHLILGVTMVVINLVLVFVSNTDAIDSVNVESAIRASVFLTNTLHQFCVGMLTLGLLVVPKIYYVRYEHVHGSLPPGVHKLVAGRVTVTIDNERVAEVDGKLSAEAMKAAGSGRSAAAKKSSPMYLSKSKSKSKSKSSGAGGSSTNQQQRGVGGVANPPAASNRRSADGAEARTAEVEEGRSGGDKETNHEWSGGCKTDGDGGKDNIANGFCDVETGCQNFVMEAESLKSSTSVNDNCDNSSVDGSEQ